MKNVKYNLLRIVYKLAETRRRSVGIAIISPSYQGKTDTLRIFALQHDSLWIVRPGTETILTQQFEEYENIKMIAVDDPSTWTGKAKTDLDAALTMCKNALDGRLSGVRTTSFLKSMSTEKEGRTGVVLFCNKSQFDKIRPRLVESGLSERLLTVWCKNQRQATTDYIEEAYQKINGDIAQLRFKNTFDFVSRNPLTTDELSFTHDLFKGGLRHSVRQIAQIIPESIFAELKPYLASTKDERFVEEEVEFEELP